MILSSPPRHTLLSTSKQTNKCSDWLISSQNQALYFLLQHTHHSSFIDLLVFSLSACVCVRACVRAWVFCDVFLPLFFTLTSVNSKRAKTKQISTKKKVKLGLCVSSKSQNFWKTMTTKKEQDLGTRKKEEIHHFIQETLPSSPPSPHSPPLSLCVLCKAFRYLLCTHTCLTHTHTQ